MAHSPAILLGLQLLNAIFIGILGGIGMLYFQDLMPVRQVQPPRSIPIRRAWAGSSQDQWRASSPRSGIITLCSGLRW